MKKSILKNIIKEAISDMEVSLKLSNGKIIHGKARTKPQALSLQIGSNTYFSFWEGKFTLSGTGSVTIVEGVDDYSDLTHNLYILTCLQGLNSLQYHSYLLPLMVQDILANYLHLNSL